MLVLSSTSDTHGPLRRATFSPARMTIALAIRRGVRATLAITTVGSTVVWAIGVGEIVLRLWRGHGIFAIDAAHVVDCVGGRRRVRRRWVGRFRGLYVTNGGLFGPRVSVGKVWVNMGDDWSSSAGVRGWTVAVHGTVGESRDVCGRLFGRGRERSIRIIGYKDLMPR